MKPYSDHLPYIGTPQCTVHLHPLVWRVGDRGLRARWGTWITRATEEVLCSIAAVADCGGDGRRRSEPATGRRGMMVQIQQIDTWWSSFGSEMGDLTLVQQQATGLDEVIPTMTVMHYCQQPMFKRPLALVKRFQVQATPPGKQARIALPMGSGVSLVHLGASTADYSQRSKAPTWEESPSLSAQDRQ